VTVRAGVQGAGFGSAAAAADYDNDGDTDLYVVNVGKNILYRNRGDGTFEEVTDSAGVGDTGTGISAVWLDIDRDSWLDLFVANYLRFAPDKKLFFNAQGYPGPLAYDAEFNVLYRNRGNGAFEDVSAASGIRIPNHRAMGVAALDCDGDGDEDLYVSNDASPNLLWVNDGRGHFVDRAAALGVAYNSLGEAAGSMMGAIGDCNGDGLSDILVTRLGYGSLYLGTAKGLFDDRMMASGLGALTAQSVAWGGNFLDFDNDGDLDVFIANSDANRLAGRRSLLLENRGEGRFVDAADKGGAFFKTNVRGRGSAVLDFDNDGRLDLLVTCLADRPVLLRNRSRGAPHWLTLRLEGTTSNRDGFGAVVTVHGGGRRWVQLARCPVGYLMQGDARLHFGLEQQARAERIEIHWPSGRRQILENVAADQTLKVKEPTG
jgi:hypothetical protein